MCRLPWSKNTSIKCYVQQQQDIYSDHVIQSEQNITAIYFNHELPNLHTYTSLEGLPDEFPQFLICYIFSNVLL